MKSSHAVLALVSAILSACGGGGDDAVNPDSPNEVMGALLFKVGGSQGTLSAGAPPVQAPGTADDAPVVSVDSTGAAVEKAGGSSFSLPVQVAAGSTMTTLFARVFGASSFSTIPVSSGQGSQSIDIELEKEFAPGQFCIEVSGQDAGALVSNVKTVCVAALPPDSLQGTYTYGDADSTLSFFSDGSYVLAARHANQFPCEPVGLEVGTYDWNEATGGLTFGDPKISFGGCGLAALTNASLVRNADATLTFTRPGQSVLTLQPVRSTPGSLIGSFQGGPSGTSRSGNRLPLATFLDDTHFTAVGLDTGPGKNQGIEMGCYSIDPVSHIVTVDLSPSTCTTKAGLPPVETNGPDGGLSHLSGSGTLVITGINSLVSNDGTTTAIGTRITTPGSPP